MKIFLVILLLVLLFELVIHIFLFFRQDKLIFYPAPMLSDQAELSVFKNDEVEINSGDIKLHGWHINKKNKKLVIYFGGNAEEVSGNLKYFSNIDSLSFLLFNYRGYGKSEGTPSEEILFIDALKIYDEFVKKSEMDYSEVIFMGRSLGSGVASFLASKREADKLILVTPFDSIAEVAKTHYPFVIIKWLLKHNFNSKEYLLDYDKKVLLILAGNDEIIPNENSENLAKAIGESANVKYIQNAHHNDIHHYEEYWSLIKKFIYLTN